MMFILRRSLIFWAVLLALGGALFVDIVTALAATGISGDSAGTYLTLSTTGGETIRLTATRSVGINTTSPAASLDLSGNADALILPTGTTGQRPATPTGGMIRYNSTTGGLEAYANSSWASIGKCSYTHSTQLYYTATTTTWNPPSEASEACAIRVRYVVIGGGGGGGGGRGPTYGGGGGGGSGYVTSGEVLLTSATAWSIIVGSGGSGGIGGSSATAGSDGNPSQIYSVGVAKVIQSNGGKGGGIPVSSDANGGNGGSGGGEGGSSGGSGGSNGSNGSGDGGFGGVGQGTIYSTSPTYAVNDIIFSTATFSAPAGGASQGKGGGGGSTITISGNSGVGCYTGEGTNPGNAGAGFGCGGGGGGTSGNGGAGADGAVYLEW